ncbi:MAG: VOC family protein [Halioglobus sp.]|jgi:catechol 2,3-dioxygenase-like lactoylglutathione lyase family enzyme|uniref:VOC family protein n=1 Tax=Halioglobus sp. Uisw_031 TaxID=3230977 RepID=UPI003591DD1A|tara:strand:- start:725 stop:1135 length:411 start_codon:yes stop_codon:yes gene_type:complete
MTASLTHLALHVRDLDACIDFYTSYADMHLVHDRVSGSKRVVWLAEKEKEINFILVLIPGGPGRVQSAEDFSHLGFALATRDAVDAVAERAKIAGILEWTPRDEPYPVGYYCGIKDPDGNFIEFSYGQPLGPGASL